MLIMLFLPFGEFIIKGLEERVPVPKNIHSNIKNIFILGGFEELDLFVTRKQLHFNHSSERVIMAVKLANQFKDSKIVFVGGSGSLNPLQNNYVNADVVKEFFKIIQFDPTRTLFIKGSRNTFENIKDLKNNPEIEEENLIITSAFHMPRVIGILKKQNLKITPYPVDYKTIKIADHYLPKDLKSIFGFFLSFSVSANLKQLDFAMRECLALAIYRITGKTESFFPKI
jgi:uncharacterized SAM-binding protein YcdF (DUF218 family)